jgi:hypothetical protein
MRAKRSTRFAVLGDVANHAPPSTGRIRMAEIAARVGISHKAAVAALMHWRRWRVLWVRSRGSGVWEVRFDRAVVERLLDAFARSPADVDRVMEEHRRRREIVAPWAFPKTPATDTPQTVEMAAGENAPR